MEIEHHVAAVREDLVRVAAVGDESTARAGEILAIALESAFGRRLQEALAEAALELTAQLDDGRVEVRLVGSNPELVYVPDAPAPPAPEPPADEFSARITLRLPEALKSRLEAAAGAGGQSLNTWLVQALGRALESSASSSTGGVGRRLTGYGRA